MGKTLGETRSADNSRDRKKKEKRNLLKVISWNINGLKEKLKDKNRKKQLLEIVSDYDVVLLQETHLGKKNQNKKKLGKKEKKSEDNMSKKFYFLDSDSENEDEEAYTTKVINFFKTSGYDVEQLQNQTCQELGRSVKSKCYITNFCSKSKGVAILVNKQHKCLKTFSSDGDYAWVYVEIDNQKYTFVSVYYHSGERSNLMMRILCSFLTQGPKAFTRPIIGGDFNTTLHYRLDKADKADKKDSAAHKSRRKSIREIMKTVNLIDVWRKKNPYDKDYTYSCKKPMSRLDYVFMLEKDLPLVKKCDIWQDEDIVPALSDHYPVKLTLTM